MKAIINGKVFTVTGQTYDKATVLIENGKIKAVGPDVQVPSDAEIIDAADCWVTPGLIDCHTHICNFSEPNSMPGLSDGTEPVSPSGGSDVVFTYTEEAYYQDCLDRRSMSCSSFSRDNSGFSATFTGAVYLFHRCRVLFKRYTALFENKVRIFRIQCCFSQLQYLQ